MLEFDDEGQGPGRPTIKVIGVGGGGGNAVNTMIEAGVEGVDFIVANTDCQVLEASLAGTKLHLGKSLTKGLGAGANPEVGRAAALEDAQRVAESLNGADMVFVTAGMGGGTGTGAAPVIAQVARDLGALTVGVVTKPFAFEGSQRKKKAAAGINELGKAVDALIVIPNDRLTGLAGMKMTLKDAFAMVDNVCLNAVRGISDLVIAPGLINVDFADVRTIMTGMGKALMGTGYGAGDKRAVEAAQQAISSPLLEDVSINGATGILLNITGGPDLTLAEMNEACSLIAEAADPDANIIFGSVIDAHAGDQVRITVIATGFNSHAQEHPTTGTRPTVRGREGQMALPMQAAAVGLGHVGTFSPSPTVGAQPTAPWTQAATPTPRGGYVAPRSAEPPPDAINLEDFYATMEQVPPAALGQTMAAQPGLPAPEWTPPERIERLERIERPERPERPIIRPSQAGGGAAPLTRRGAPQMQSPRPADELGVEESEFDKPAYLRRGVYAPE